MGVRIQCYRGNTPATAAASASPPARTSRLVPTTETEG